MGSVIRWATNQTFTNTQDGDMVQKIINGDLIIASGVTVTTQYRCKGLHIQVRGNMYLYGTIDMTARGANAVGQNVGIEAYSDRNLISLNGGNYAGLPTVRKIPATGALGGLGVTATASLKVNAYTNGLVGSSGTNGQCGGGGSGMVSAQLTGPINSNRGGNGSSFSGGTGSGQVATITAGTWGGIGSDVGGAGGAARNDGWAAEAVGSTGNPGGLGMANNVATTAGNSGTGGLIIITVLGYLYINSGAYIKSNGTNGLVGAIGSAAASGGGSINILYGTLTNNGTLQANGGIAPVYTDANYPAGSKSGDGGAGSIRTNSLRTT